MARRAGRPRALYQVSSGYDHRGIPRLRGARDSGLPLLPRYRSQRRPHADRKVHQDGDRQALPIHEHAVGGAAPAHPLQDRRDRKARWRPVDVLCQERAVTSDFHMVLFYSAQSILLFSHSLITIIGSSWPTQTSLAYKYVTLSCD